MSEALDVVGRLNLIEANDRAPVDVEVFHDGDAANSPAPWVATVRLPGGAYTISAPSFYEAWKAAKQAAAPATEAGPGTIFGTRPAPLVLTAPEPMDEPAPSDESAGDDEAAEVVDSGPLSRVGYGGGATVTAAQDATRGEYRRLLPDPRDVDEPEGAAVIAAELQLGDLIDNEVQALAVGNRIIRRLYRDGYELAIRP